MKFPGKVRLGMRFGERLHGLMFSETIYLIYTYIFNYPAFFSHISRTHFVPKQNNNQVTLSKLH